MTTVLIYRDTKKRQWVVDHPVDDDRRKRRYFASKDAANNHARSLREQIARGGEAWFNLSAPDRDKLMSAWYDAKMRGIDIGELLASGKRPSPHGDGPALRAVVDDLVKQKKAHGLSHDYCYNLELVLGQFLEGREMTPIGLVTIRDLEEWLASKSLASRKTLRQRLSALFIFAMQREYRKDNPVAALLKLKYQKPPPKTLTLDQTKACLEFLTTKRKSESLRQGREWFTCYRFALPWFVMTTFCGLRPEEAQQIERHEINFKEGWIKVEAHVTKVRCRRVVYPKAEAMALLHRSMGKGRLPLGDKGRKQIIYRLREHLGLKIWVRDFTRHTAASNWVADCQSISDVATALGNSEHILRRDYLALVTKSEAEQFWKLCSQFLIG